MQPPPLVPKAGKEAAGRKRSRLDEKGSGMNALNARCGDRGGNYENGMGASSCKAEAGGGAGRWSLLARARAKLAMKQAGEAC